MVRVLYLMWWIKVAESYVLFVNEANLFLSLHHMATTTKIYIGAVTGLTPEIQIYDGDTPIGSPIAATEIGTTGNYFAFMPEGVPYGQYLLIASAGDAVIAQGEMRWSGQYEITEATAMLRGLDPNNPATQTLTNLTAGNIDIEVSGDLENTTTFTAQP